jgi:hypothetical protein
VQDTAPFDIAWVWDLPKVAGKQKDAQDKQRKEFEAVLQRLEDKQLNGVEFECQGKWVKSGTGFSLRVTSVPQLTTSGQKRLTEHRR